ncbi:MAG: hypothetical protein ACI9LY_003686, partial [Arenicella sp.]
MKFSRRTLLKTSVAAATGLTAAACKPSAQNESSIPVPVQESAVGDLLKQATDLILNAYPESTSSAGIDKGEYLRQKSELTDRSPQGQAKIKADVKAMLTKLNKVDTSKLTSDQALNVDVVRTVFDMSAKGFDMAYGEVALLNFNWSWRNSPYAVAQNTGA